MGITIALICLNELMALLTMVLVFPGMLPPEDSLEWFLFGAFLFLLSFVWWLYLALAPIAFFILYLCGDWKPSDHAKEWPWRHIFRPQR